MVYACTQHDTEFDFEAIEVLDFAVVVASKKEEQLTSSNDCRTDGSFRLTLLGQMLILEFLLGIRRIFQRASLTPFKNKMRQLHGLLHYMETTSK
jgi:hypothetical protein